MADTTENKPWSLDNYLSWEPIVSQILCNETNCDHAQKLRQFSNENEYEIVDFLLSLCNRQNVYSSLKAWVLGRPLIAYHGSRLQKHEIKSIQNNGLKTMTIMDRGQHIQQKMKNFQSWDITDHKLNRILENRLCSSTNGVRNGRVSLLLSKQRLEQLHYLTEGSEFDSLIIYNAVGKAGRDHLHTYGMPVIFSIKIPAPEIASAFTFHKSFPEIAPENGDFPSPFLQLLHQYVARIVSNSSIYDTELKFSKDIPESWIIDTEIL